MFPDLISAFAIQPNQPASSTHQNNKPDNNSTTMTVVNSTNSKLDTDSLVHLIQSLQLQDPKSSQLQENQHPHHALQYMYKVKLWSVLTQLQPLFAELNGLNEKAGKIWDHLRQSFGADQSVLGNLMTTRLGRNKTKVDHFAQHHASINRSVRHKRSGAIDNDVCCPT